MKNEIKVADVLPKNAIMEYVRQRRSTEPVGVVVASQVGNEIRYGWSLAKTTKDKFNKVLGVKIAVGRLGVDAPENEIPHTIQKRLEQFKVRAAKYYRVLV